MNNQSQGMQLANQLSDLVNGGSRKNQEDFVKTITSDHPTLQQSTFRLMIDAMRIWAEKYDQERFDLRNEQTCKLSKMMLKAIENEGLPYV